MDHHLCIQGTVYNQYSQKMFKKKKKERTLNHTTPPGLFITWQVATLVTFYRALHISNTFTPPLSFIPAFHLPSLQIHPCIFSAFNKTLICAQSCWVISYHYVQELNNVPLYNCITTTIAHFFMTGHTLMALGNKFLFTRERPCHC